MKKQFEENKNLSKLVLDRILQVLQEEKKKFNFSTSLETAKKLGIKQYAVYKSTHAGARDIALPLNDNYDFNNQLAAIENNTDYSFELNFILKNGESTNLVMAGKNKQTVRIDPPDSQITKILVNYDPEECVTGIKMYTKEDKCVLSIGVFEGSVKEILLQEGERILGIKSRLYEEGCAYQNDLVFVTGKME